MTGPGGPGRRGRHSAGDATGGIPSFPWTAGGLPAGPGAPSPSTGGTGVGFRPAGDVPAVSGVLHRDDDRTGPLPEPAWWSHGSSDHPHHPRARHGGGDDGTGRPEDPQRPETQHPSAPLPPLPTGVWNRLQPRTDGPVDDDATVAAPIGGFPDDGHGHEHHDDHYDDHDHYDDQHADHHDAGHPEAEHHDPAEGRTDSWEATGGLDVIGDHVDDPHGSDAHDDGPAGAHPLTAADRRGGRRRRRPLAVLLSLLVLGGLVAGIVLGVQALTGMFSAEDYTGQGTGDVQIRVQDGDTLSDIARTLVDEDVIASTRPFVDAAEGRPEATGIQPGVYGLRSQMSGAAALDMLLGEGSRVLSRVTIPEGLTVAQVLERVASETGKPIEELQAAAADTAALGLPAYAGGQLEGYLFPATYDVEPDQTSAQILTMMVDQFNTVATRLDLEGRAAAAGRTPADVVTVASMIQSETRLDEERPDVAQVIYNRLAQGIPLGIDATLAFGLDKSGNDLTVTDLRTDSPYNTRTRQGLPPTPISSPGEASLEAALAPSSGNLLYYVLENSDGTHFFTADYAEFQAARQRCADAGLGCGG